MAVKLRLMRMGKKKQPSYRVVAADSRSPRDGRFIELIGRYDPRPDPSVVEIDNEAALKWLNQGAQPTPQVRKLLEISGAWTDYRVSRGDVHVAAPAETPEADVPPAAAVVGHQPEIHVVGGDTEPAEEPEAAEVAEDTDAADTEES